jgi:hypothetical protein
LFVIGIIGKKDGREAFSRETRAGNTNALWGRTRMREKRKKSPLPPSISTVHFFGVCVIFLLRFRLILSELRQDERQQQREESTSKSLLQLAGVYTGNAAIFFMAFHETKTPPACATFSRSTSGLYRYKIDEGGGGEGRGGDGGHEGNNADNRRTFTTFILHVLFAFLLIEVDLGN